jgi:hypothetical protein
VYVKFNSAYSANTHSTNLSEGLHISLLLAKALNFFANPLSVCAVSFREFSVFSKFPSAYSEKNGDKNCSSTAWSGLYRDRAAENKERVNFFI